MATGLTVVKRFPYRGDTTEEFSNTYFFTGTTPASPSAWRTLFDALVTQEATILANDVGIIRGYGYSSSDEDAHAVWSVDLTIAPEVVVGGGITIGTNRRLPGDAAVWIRWKTSRLTEKGKPIYLRKYFHPALQAASPSSTDAVLPAWITAANAFAVKMTDGSFSGARKICGRGHEDDVITGYSASPYVTTRTLKRRGKRPGS